MDGGSKDEIDTKLSKMWKSLYASKNDLIIRTLISI